MLLPSLSTAFAYTIPFSKAVISPPSAVFSIFAICSVLVIPSTRCLSLSPGDNSYFFLSKPTFLIGLPFESLKIVVQVIGSVKPSGVLIKAVLPFTTSILFTSLSVALLLSDMVVSSAKEAFATTGVEGISICVHKTSAKIQLTFFLTPLSLIITSIKNVLFTVNLYTGFLC